MTRKQTIPQEVGDSQLSRIIQRHPFWGKSKTWYVLSWVVSALLSPVTTKIYSCDAWQVILNAVLCLLFRVLLFPLYSFLSYSHNLCQMPHIISNYFWSAFLYLLNYCQVHSNIEHYITDNRQNTQDIHQHKIVRPQWQVLCP